MNIARGWPPEWEDWARLDVEEHEEELPEREPADDEQDDEQDDETLDI